jgi:Flp pilus assembly protein TadB
MPIQIPIFVQVLDKTMNDKDEETDLQEVYKGVAIYADNCLENIKDARRALRHATTRTDRKIYRNVIRHNRNELRDARNKMKILKARSGTTWWLWLTALLLSIVLMIVIPGAPLYVVFAPVWIIALIGVIGILFYVKR